MGTWSLVFIFLLVFVVVVPSVVDGKSFIKEVLCGLECRNRCRKNSQWYG